MEKRTHHHQKSGKVFVGAALALVLLMLTLIVFTVDTAEYAVVTQFGNPVAVIREPGLNVKLPDPVQTVQRLDKRIQVYQANALELLTLDKKSAAIDYYGTWKISDPVVYLKTVKDKPGAEARLLDVFSAGLRVQFGKYNLDELVNVDAEQLKLDGMLTEAVAYARGRTAEYGIKNPHFWKLITFLITHQFPVS
ncbi:MAG: hypothetical protein LBD55_01045 [Treponema sp.]|jgi:membrane protease subunit HflC|nr:hypothetical protein [Treponema sp.]